MRGLSIVFLVLSFSPTGFSMTKSEQELLQPLIDSHEINLSEDEVVLLQSANGMKDFLNVQNKSDDQSAGYCLGITQAELTLLSAIKFDAHSGRKDTDQEIYQKLHLAMDTQQWQPQTIYGISYEDFIKKMTETWEALDKNPLRRVVEEYQTQHGLKIDSARKEIKIIAKPTHAARSPQQNILTSSIKSPEVVATELKLKIDHQIPSSLSIFQEMNKSINLSDDGHALIVVGYVKSKKEGSPSRFLVVDPNFPQKLKMIQIDPKTKEWSYPFPSKGSNPDIATPVVASTFDPEISRERDAQLAKVFQKPHPTLLTSAQTCPGADPMREANSIFEAASK
ncbi:MAG: hypothetical protein JWQ35_2232 [Bacteriovoracaceae bacterium]|nr:hypothetical protein [Bacteriovoracaceae bacterium]